MRSAGGEAGGGGGSAVSYPEDDVGEGGETDVKELRRVEKR